MERSDNDTRQRRVISRLRAGFIILVAGSAGLVATYARGSLLDVLLSMLGGILLAIFLIWLAFPSPDRESKERVRARR